jgi:hypothetical protein
MNYCKEISPMVIYEERKYLQELVSIWKRQLTCRIKRKSQNLAIEWKESKDGNEWKEQISPN